MSYILLVVLIIALYQFTIYMSITNSTPGNASETVGNVYYKKRGKLEVLVVTSAILNLLLILGLAYYLSF